MARRPRWIGALILALAIASAFAALGQWQLSRSLEGGDPTAGRTEISTPLSRVAEPQQPLRSDAIGQRVTVSGTFVEADYVLLSGRSNHDAFGYWVVGHVVTDDGASLAVALGWAPTESEAIAALEDVRATPPGPNLAGRYLMSESPEQSDFEAGERSALAVSELINLWTVEPDGVYAGYLVLDEAPAGLTTIDAPPPITEVSLNLLNIFYALEWAVFAGFAVYLWYRLVRDAVEAEDAQNEAARAAATGEPEAPAPGN
jgi:cytochrome oxidase assembly protein ShyY1